jgi:hypothetical protein
MPKMQEHFSAGAWISVVSTSLAALATPVLSMVEGLNANGFRDRNSDSGIS